jgi:hypothetical protein
MNHVASALAVCCLLLAACSRQVSPSQPDTPTVPVTQPMQVTERANPASQRCVEVMGRLIVERRPDGGEFGVCYFDDNRQCEEWAMYRGECPIGGRRITGYATEAGRYCAITGGQYTGVVASDNSERGDCELAGGKKCDADEYWRGTCSR